MNSILPMPSKFSTGAFVSCEAVCLFHRVDDYTKMKNPSLSTGREHWVCIRYESIHGLFSLNVASPAHLT
jgi:hypothetical protein